MSSASASSAAGSSLAGPSGQSSSSSSRVVVQDYIARIRYSNALPPPPTPPKLLDIPVAGIAQYTDAGFAARLAREQPLTVEADAELGMPIDMVGVPGVFFDDESCKCFHVVDWGKLVVVETVLNYVVEMILTILIW